MSRSRKLSLRSQQVRELKSKVPKPQVINIKSQ
jgi:hypothetical protein